LFPDQRRALHPARVRYPPLLQEDEQLLEERINALQEGIRRMTDEPANQSRLYVTDADIAALPCVAKDTVLAVRAPHGTTLEVPDPDDGPLVPGGPRSYR
jgi:transcription factor E2F3